MGDEGDLPTNGAQAAILKQIWIYGINDHLDGPADVALPEGFEATGVFHTDYLALCERFDLVPHTAFAVRRSALLPEEDTIISVSSILLDRATMQVVRCLLPASPHLRTIRFSNAKLDCEMMALLRSGLEAESCTVTTLQIDWNPIEMPLEIDTARGLGDNDDMDALERDRDLKQAQRSLRAIKELLLQIYGFSCDEEAWAGFEGKAGVSRLEPLERHPFAECFVKALGTSTVLGDPLPELLECFEVLDGPHFVGGEGKVSIEFCKKAFDELPPLPEGEEAPPDPIGLAFGSFTDEKSVLEAVSFRECDVGNFELEAMCKAMIAGTGNLHLRSLNLWCNRVDDRGAKLLAEVLEVHFGLEYLGLARNRVTIAGLKELCGVVGAVRVTDKKEPVDIEARIKDQDAAKAAKLKAPVVKKDANGRDRYMPLPHVDEIEERITEGEEPETYWLWFRNVELKTLNLGENPIESEAEVEVLQPLGTGTLVLKGCPCAKPLLEKQREREQEEKKKKKKLAAEEGGGEESMDGAMGDEGVAAAEEEAAPSRPKGWTVVLT